VTVVVETQVADRADNAAQQVGIQFLLLLLLTEAVEVDLVIPLEVLADQVVVVDTELAQIIQQVPQAAAPAY